MKIRFQITEDKKSSGFWYSDVSKELRYYNVNKILTQVFPEQSTLRST